MGKKRQFKRSDDKKVFRRSPGFQQPPPGIVIPAEVVYADTRSRSHDYTVPTPPMELTEEEIRAEKEREARASQVVETRMQAPAEEEMPLYKPSRGKQKLTDAIPATLELPDVDGSEDAQPEPDQTGPEKKDDSDEKKEEPNSGASRRRKTIAELIEEANSDVEMEGARRQLLASAWRARDQVYRQLFGNPAYVLPSSYCEPSTEVPHNFGKKPHLSGADTGEPGEPEAEEQHLAVLAYGPDPQAPYWRYITAGLASPWTQYEPLEVSGFGCEIMVKSSVDSPWAAQFLRTLAFHIFKHAGVFSQGARLKLNGSIDPASDSKLRNAFFWYADEAPETLYELPSGLFSILLAVGITDGELSFADSVEEYGTWCIQALLRQAGVHQVTDPKRDCSMEHENINAMKMSVRNFAETFRANRAGKFTVDDTTFS